MITFRANAGFHDRRHTPVRVALEEGITDGQLMDDETGEAVASQIFQGHLHFILENLSAGHEHSYRFLPGESSSAPSRGVAMRHKKKANRIDIRVHGRMFTSYHYSSQFPRPHFHPVIGPHGRPMTRAHPTEKIAGETNDHKHHRSLWIAHGDVNGTDNWTEEKGHGWQTHRGFAHIVEGPVFGEFLQKVDWEDSSHNRVLEETRAVRVYATPDSFRSMQFTVQLRATEGEVRLGDTKEGGLCSVRVATVMDGDKGGQIRNSAGGIGETECWGMPAHWCDYQGEINGKKLGIAIFDHPLNLRHPTCWHVRDYGLMTANPFGYSDYLSSFIREGSYTIAAGETLVARYQLFLHKPDSRKSMLADRYYDYAQPPAIQAIST